MAYSYGPIVPAPTSKPIAVNRHATLNTSYRITLNTQTTGVELTAFAKGILMRWDGTASATNFDGAVAPDSSKVFMRPSGVTTIDIVDEDGAASMTCIQF